ncbi:MAG: hypothetical protein ACXQS2_01705 [Methermicoccaceae archaeon]
MADDLERLLKKLREYEEERTKRIRRRTKKLKVCPESLEGRRDVKVIKADEVKNWRIELFQPRGSDKKGLFLSRNKGELCVTVAAGLPPDLKIEHIFENPKIPGYVKDVLIDEGYIDEILT